MHQRAEEKIKEIWRMYQEGEENIKEVERKCRWAEGKTERIRGDVSRGRGF